MCRFRPEFPAQRLCRNMLLIFRLPRWPVGSWEGMAPIDSQRQLLLSAGTRRKVDSSVGLAPAGQNRHHRPVGTSKHALKGFFVDSAGTGRVPRVRVNPDAGELFWTSPKVDLLVKEICDGNIVKCDGDDRANLLDQHNIFNEQQVFRGRNSESADLGRPYVTQKQ